MNDPNPKHVLDWEATINIDGEEIDAIVTVEIDWRFDGSDSDEYYTVTYFGRDITDQFSTDDIKGIIEEYNRIMHG